MAYGVGAALRQERTRREITLTQISGQTRISERFLTAIEKEDFEALPGIVFTRNFVRQYALALELDPEPLLAQLPRVDVTEARLPLAPVREKSSAWDPRWNSVFATIAWLALAIGAAVMAWLHFNKPASTHPETRAAVAAPVLKQEETRPPVQTVIAQAPPAAIPAPQPSGARHPVEVVLTAKEESWVQVTADGKVAFTATLKPNESRSVSADDQVKLVTGNAGGVTVSLNGKTLDALGPSGQVRVLRLTAAGPQFVQKTPPPPPGPL